MIVASRVRWNVPTGNDVSLVAAFSNAKKTPSGRSRTCVSSRPCSSAGLVSMRFALHAGAGVERHAAPSESARRPGDVHGHALVVPGRPRPLVVTPRGHIRPDKRERERPPADRVGGRLPGVAEGVAHAPSSLCTISRAASAAAQNAAAFLMTARAHPLVRQRVAASASSEGRHHHHRQSAVQFSGLKGDNSDPRRCPPFCPPWPSARAAIN